MSNQGAEATYQSGPSVSLPLMVPTACHVERLMLLVTQRTEPSHSKMLTPLPPW